MVAPFSFIFKVINAPLLEWVHLWGNPNTGKTSSGLIGLAFDGNEDVKNFRRTLNELVLDNDIKNVVEHYNELYTRLMTDDERIDELSGHIRYLHEYIHSGRFLAGPPPICDLCLPPYIKR
jgi:hypothetical protein